MKKVTMENKARISETRAVDILKNSIELSLFEDKKTTYMACVEAMEKSNSGKR